MMKYIILALSISFISIAVFLIYGAYLESKEKK